MKTPGPTLRRSDREMRIFISYSHSDRTFVRELARVLRDQVGVQPFYDEHVRIGRGFSEEIQRGIANTHVFMPVLTSASDQRKWVHQEIGYAAALNIPFLPLALDRLPGQMIKVLQAVRLSRRNLAPLLRDLTQEKLINLVKSKAGPQYALYQCASLPYERATWMASYSNDVLQQGYAGLLRQRGGLSSMNIPRESLSHPVWERRYAPHGQTPDHMKAQRDERLGLEAHARGAGCRLIINPDIEYPDLNREAVIARLTTLKDFLVSMTDESCQVAWNARMTHGDSVTIVGSWFSAEAVLSRKGKGYFQTVFTRHAPSLMDKIDAFEDDFESHLALHGWSRADSRMRAIELVDRKIAALKA